jgi:hypothetical protein
MPWSASIKGLTALQDRFTYVTRHMGETAGRILDKRLGEAVAYARATYLTGGTTTTRLAERTGRLKRSFVHQVQVAGQGGGTLVTARIGYLKDSPSWVGIHEHGGTIRPRIAHYLAIPLTEEARQTPPRQMQDTFVARSRNTGSLLIFKKVEGGGIIPEYVLKTSVTIPARPALAPTMAKFKPLIADDLRRGVRALIQGRR